MAFPNVTDIVATTIEARSRRIQDQVSKNNALLAKLQKSGQRTFSGGSLILEELSFAENGNQGWYSGYDLLPVAAQDVITAAQYDIKQAACPVICSGLDQLKNAGREQMIDLMEGRIKVAESTMQNLVSAGVYSDGSGAGGKQLTGLDAAVPINGGSTGTYGGIDSGAWPFWRSKVSSGTALTATNIQGAFNALWCQLVRGADRPDLIVVDNFMWSTYLASLQAQQRFTGTSTGNLGFPELLYMDCPVILDGAIGGFATVKTAYFLNTKYLNFRPHADRNFVPLNPNRRYAINQDAEVQILAFAGNLTCSGRMFQGRLISS